MCAKKKGAGGKLARSEIVTVRLDQRLRFAAELAARKQRRTVSSFIEWAVEQAVSNVIIRDNGERRESDSIMDMMPSIWDVEEPDRIIKCALLFPELLNFDEERKWKLIQNHPYFWKGVETRSSGAIHWRINIGNIKFYRVRACWELLNKIIAGEEKEEAIPNIPESEIIGRKEEDDDVPF